MVRRMSDCDPTPEQDTAVEDAYVAFIAGRITRDEFFEIAEWRAKDCRDSSARSSAQMRGSDQD